MRPFAAGRNTPASRTAGWLVTVGVAVLACRSAAGLPGLSPDEQRVVDRAEGFDLCDGVHCQLYEPGRIRTSRFAAVARAAVERTAGMILAYSNRPAEVLFHADCGGHTAQDIPDFQLLIEDRNDRDSR